MCRRNEGLSALTKHTLSITDNRCERAAVVVYRVRKGRVEFLLVSRNSDPDQFVLPGGRVEAGESFKEAALRECVEESGVKAQLEGRLVQFDHRNKRGVVKPTRVYLACLSKQRPSPEGREVVWARYEDLHRYVYDVPGPTLEVLEYAAQCLDAVRIAA